MCRGHDPLFSGQSALPSLPIYHHCAALVPPHFQILEKFPIFSSCFGQNFSSQDANFPNFRSQDPLFFKKNPLPRPYFWKPVWHTPTNKKLSAPPGFSSETKEPKLHKLGVFGANYCKKHPIWSTLGAFLSKMVYWWVGNLAKNWYRDSQIFEVRQAHPRTILVKEPPPPVKIWNRDIA